MKTKNTLHRGRQVSSATGPVQPFDLSFVQDRLLRRNEVATILGVAAETLRGMAFRGIGPASTWEAAAAPRYWLADVQAWLAELNPTFGPVDRVA